MDNEFKGIFRFLSIVLFLSLIWAGLTKFGLIPNWFDVEILSPQEEISLRFAKKVTGEIDGKKLKIITFSNCPNIFFQPVEDDESTWKYYLDEDHKYYYRDSENKKMILMPNISYVDSSDCESYDKWFVEDGFKTRMDDLGIQIMEQHICREYSPDRSICSSEVTCKKVYYSSDYTRYKCCNQEGECVFKEDYAITIPDCSKGPC